MMRGTLLLSVLIIIGCGTVRPADPCAEYHRGDLGVRRSCFVERVRELAGPEVTYCGETTAHPANPNVLNCAVDRFQNSRPFVMVEWVRGIDSDLAHAWMLRSDGSFCALRYDDHWAGRVEKAMGPLECGTAELVYGHGRVWFDFRNAENG